MLVIVVVAIAAGTVGGWALVARARNRRLESTFRLGIYNRGNMPSRYQLRAEEPADALSFRFELAGEGLPVEEIPLDRPGMQAAPPPAQRATVGTASKASKAATVGEKAGDVMATGSGLAQLLSSIGSLLPRSVGAPFLQWSSKISIGQLKIRQAEQAPRRFAKVGSILKPSKKTARSASETANGPARTTARSGFERVDGLAERWHRTPPVQPGQTLTLDLVVRSMIGGKAQERSFRVVSRSAELDEPPLVVAEGIARTKGGFWAHSYLPFVFVLALAVGAMLLAYWLAANGVLTW